MRVVKRARHVVRGGGAACGWSEEMVNENRLQCSARLMHRGLCVHEKEGLRAIVDSMSK